MSGNTIEVQWLATVTGALQAIDKLNSRLDKQEKALVKISDTSVKGNNAAVGSYQRLEMELRKNEARLKQLAMGTAEWGKQKKKVDELRGALSRAKGELQTAAGGMNSTLSSGVAKLTALGAGMLSFQKVVSVVVAELEHVKQLKLDAAAVNRTFEQAIVDMAPNLAGLGDPAQMIPQAKQLITERATEVGADPARIANLVGVAVSAGATDIKQAIELATVGLKLTAGDAEKAVPLVGGMLDIAGKGNTTNFMGSMGQLLQSMGEARATNLQMFAENMGPGVAAATRDMPRMKGMTTEQAMETISVFTQVLGDQTGAKSATVLNQYFARLGDFVPERTKKLDDGRISKVTQAEIDAFVNERDYAKKKALMRASPGIMDQFVDTQREGNAKGTIREFLAGSERIDRWLAKAEKAVEPLELAQNKTAQLIAQIEKESIATRTGRKSDALRNVADFGSVRAIEGQAIKDTMETIRAADLAGVDAIGVKFAEDAFSMASAKGVDATQVAINVLTMLREGLVKVGNREDEKKFTEQIEVLRDLRDEIKASRMAREREGGMNRNGATKPREAPLPAVTTP